MKYEKLPTFVSGVVTGALLKLLGVARFGAVVTVAEGATSFGSSAFAGALPFVAFEAVAFGFAGVVDFLGPQVVVRTVM